MKLTETKLRHIIRQELKSLKESKYDLMFGDLGGGISVVNKNEDDPDTRDYKKVAHIHYNGKVKWYDMDAKKDPKVRREVEKHSNLAKKSFNKNESVNKQILFKFPDGSVNKEIGKTLKGLLRVEDDGVLVFKDRKSASIASEKLNNSSILSSSSGNYVYLESIKKSFTNESSSKPMMTKSGSDIFVDTTFVQNSNKFGKLDHIWMGDFSVDTPDGKVEFRRVDKTIDGFSGRVHRLVGDDKAKKSLIKKMKPKVVKESFTNESIKKDKIDQFNSKLKNWANRYGINYKWSFKNKREKTDPYFVLDLTHDEYTNSLPSEARDRLNRLLKSYNVDFLYKNNKWTPVIESTNESATRTAMEIGSLTGLNKNVVQKFVDDNNLDIEKVFDFVKKGKLPQRLDFVTAVVGKPGNSIQKKLLKVLGESINEDATIVLVNPNTNKFVKTIMYSGPNRDVDKEVEKLNTKLSKSQKEKGFYWKVSSFESINEDISVFDERPYGKKGIIIMIDDNGKKTSAVFKDKKNADKYNRNNVDDIRKLLKLAKSKPFGKAIDESINESTKFYAFYDRKKIEIEADSLWDAKQKAIKQLRVPKSKVGLLSIVNAGEHSRGSFRYENVNEANIGDKMKHKYTDGISIELLDTTNKGWKVKQTGDGTPRGKNKTKIAYFDTQDISGDKAIFVKQ